MALVSTRPGSFGTFNNAPGLAPTQTSPYSTAINTLGRPANPPVDPSQYGPPPGGIMPPQYNPLPPAQAPSYQQSGLANYNQPLNLQSVTYQTPNNQQTGQTTNNSSTSPAAYDPSKPGFIWRDGSMHNTPEPGNGQAQFNSDGSPNPNYFGGGPTAPVSGLNAAGSNGSVASPFGPNPFMTNVGWAGPNGTSGSYNPTYFPTQSAANQVAQMLGGTVFSQNNLTNAPSTPFMQNQPNYMVKLANGQVINPADVINAYSHGYSQPMIDQLLSSIVNNSPTTTGNAFGPIMGSTAVNNGAMSQLATPGVTTSFSNQPSQNPYANPSAFGGQNLTQFMSAPPGNSQTSPMNMQAENLISQLFGGQQQTNPFNQAVTQLYGANPFNLYQGLFGNAGMNALGNSSNSLLDIATLLNALSGLNGPLTQNNGQMSPLFWGQSAMPIALNQYYPAFA